MNDVALMIHHITEDLRALQNAMQTVQYERLPDSADDGQLKEIVSTEAATELRCALDEMRHLLWWYAELVAAKEPSESSQSSVDRSYRRLVAEMLQIFSRRAPLSMPTLPGTASFFERIDFVVSCRLAMEEQRCASNRDAA